RRMMKHRGRRVVGVISVVAIGFAWLAGRGCGADELPVPPRAGSFTVQLKSGGWDRTATVHVPAGYETTDRLPLVVALHGAGGDGSTMLRNNGWAAKADREKFIVVAPDGMSALPRLPNSLRANPNLWNSGQLGSRSPRARIDDVAFIDDLLDMLKDRLPYDERRVYVTGHSNGAGMTFRLGAELSERFAALAPVSGMLAVDDPRPKRPLPTLYIIGTLDPLQPIDGGEVTLPWGTKRTNVPVADYLTSWAKAIDCSTEPKIVSDEAGIKRVEYPSNSDGPTVSAIYIEGQGHEWPGGNSRLPVRMIGPKTDKLKAVDVIWDFFRDKSAPK
ncbi:MAG: alpha/beta fold hydrolase, partial [Planctomycetales bacterium]|nr:alpha/beta fold hydrolase [Planctomycetales bacterium]